MCVSVWTVVACSKDAACSKEATCSKETLPAAKTPLAAKKPCLTLVHEALAAAKKELTKDWRKEDFGFGFAKGGWKKHRKNRYEILWSTILACFIKF